MRTRRRFTAKRRDPKTLVSWILTRGTRLLTCRVDGGNRGSRFAVAVLPHWAATHTIVERFTAPAAALARHAGMVTDLRNAGWRLAAYADK